MNWAHGIRRLRWSLAVGAWAWSGEPVRFLAVLVVATPCPLLIAIPVAIIGAISLAAKRSIIIRDPAVLERIDQCRTIILDKTGTLTYGQPTLTDRFTAAGVRSTIWCCGWPRAWSATRSIRCPNRFSMLRSNRI